MLTLKENDVEWALKHLRLYSHSDFYPRIFEFDAISHNWQQVKEFILSIDLNKYYPKSPMINLAPKTNRTFRIVHQLDPIDSIFYTALVRELCETIENYRIPESAKIACSYRIKPDLEGSFFSKETGWESFLSQSQKFAKKYKSGYVIVADITDFYNQIYTHRITNLIEEAGSGFLDKQARVMENFLLALNNNTSRGIPVGPYPSIILSELIMASIDKKILTYTDNFVRYVDDIRIFFANREDAIFTLHELTQYLYSFHRLVLSGEKTNIYPMKKFSEDYLRNEEKEEKRAVRVKAEELADEKMYELLNDLGPYDSFDYDEEYEKALTEVMDDEKIKLLSDSYTDIFNKSISVPIDFILIRHVLRKSKKYRIRSLVPMVLDNFEKMLPVIREVIIYLNAVINDEIVSRHKSKFGNILLGHYMKLPFVNLWISYLLQNRHLSTINLSKNYGKVQSIRDRALIARTRQDTTWIRDFRDNIHVLGPWDKRAVLYSSSILPSDEMKPWISISAASGDIVDRSISSYLISQNKSRKKKTP